MPLAQQGAVADRTAPTNMHVPFVGVITPNLTVQFQSSSPSQVPSLPTPVLVDKLSTLLIDSNYDQQLAHNLIHGFTYGFHIPFSGSSQSHNSHPRNHPSVLDNAALVDKMIKSELELGRIAGPFSFVPLNNFVISPLGLIPKKEVGSFRLIHDLSFPKGNSINFGIPREFCTVSYEDYDYFVPMLAYVGRGCYIAKADIESAFRIIPINPSDYHLLGFTMGKQYLYDRCLPMGCSVSCKLFEDFSCAIQWILQRSFNVLTMSHILDDFIFVSQSETLCCDYLDAFHSVARLVGIPVKHSKTVPPSTCVTVHGIEIDTSLMQARLPQDKLNGAIALVKSFSRRKKVTLRVLQSLIGTLSFACKVVVPGRPFLRRLINLTIGVSKPSFHIRLNKEARLDLSAWLIFLESYNGVSVLLDDQWLSSEKLELFTDASNLGFAGVLHGVWFQGSWPASWLDKHIAVRELFPIVLALKLWFSQLCGKRLLILCDNEAVVYVSNDQTSRDSNLMSLIRTMAVLVMQHNVILRAKHVPGKLKRTLSPYFRNLPLLHITIRLHLTSRLLKFMQWLARKQYVLVVGNAI